MNLYYLTQNDNTDYDTYSDMVVAAETEEEARCIHPIDLPFAWSDPMYGWAKSPDNVKVELIGKAAKHVKYGIICKSYRAG
jgi:hypothetical protein